jgi:putative aldouronate transport system substrate-binding protein
MKKFLSILLAMMMILTLFAGCEKEPESTDETTGSTEREIIDWLMRDIGSIATSTDLKIIDYFEDVADLNINIIKVPVDVYADKLSIMIAGDTLPDIVNVGNQDLFIEALTPDYQMIKDISTKGMLVALSDNYDKLSNYKAFIDKYPDYVGGITSSDGKIYFASTVRDYSPTSSLGGVIRSDIVESLGYDMTFESFDELLACLTAMRGTTDGPIWTNRSGLLNLNLLSYSFGTSLMDVPYYDQYAGKFVNPVSTQNFKDAVIFFKTLVERDILTPEWATYPEPQWYQDSMTGVCLFWVDNMMNVPTMNNGLVTNSLEGQFEAFVPPVYNDTFYGWAGKSRFSTTGSVISAKTENLDGILRLIDWFYDMDNHDLLYWGIEGETCIEYNGKLMNPDTTTKASEEFMNKILAFGCGENSNWMKVFTDAEYYNDRAFDGARKWAVAGKVYGDNVYTYSVPSVVIGEADTETINSMKTALDTYIQESVTNFINGKASMDEFDAFVAKVSEMGADQIVAIYNAALE